MAQLLQLQIEIDAYSGFLQKCAKISTKKVYNNSIPLDLKGVMILRSVMYTNITIKRKHIVAYEKHRLTVRKKYLFTSNEDNENYIAKKYPLHKQRRQ